jgi:predicted nucleic acid-binding protein
MGLILDSSLLIANERGRFDMAAFLKQFSSLQSIITAITASELLHGVERAQDAGRKARRQQHVEQILATIFIQPFDLAQARVHARIWAQLETGGKMIGSHDLLIAAAAIAHGHQLATLNIQEFRRVTGLNVIDATPWLK